MISEALFMSKTLLHRRYRSRPSKINCFSAFFCPLKRGVVTWATGHRLDGTCSTSNELLLRSIHWQTLQHSNVSVKKAVQTKQVDGNFNSE